MRQKTLLLAPVMSKLDHVRPALHRLSKYEQKDVDVRLIPLLKHTQPRLEIFCEFMKIKNRLVAPRKAYCGTVCTIW